MTSVWFQQSCPFIHLLSQSKQNRRRTKFSPIPNPQQVVYSSKQPRRGGFLGYLRFWHPRSSMHSFTRIKNVVSTRLTKTRVRHSLLLYAPLLASPPGRTASRRTPLPPTTHPAGFAATEPRRIPTGHTRTTAAPRVRRHGGGVGAPSRTGPEALPTQVAPSRARTSRRDARRRRDPRSRRGPRSLRQTRG